MSQSDTHNAAGGTQNSSTEGAHKRWWERDTRAARTNGPEREDNTDSEAQAESANPPRHNRTATGSPQIEKRWWERQSGGPPPATPAQAHHIDGDDHDDQGVNSKPTAARETRPTAASANETDLPQAQAMPSMGAANHASRKRWWEQKGDAPASGDAMTDTHAAAQTTRTQSRPAPEARQPASAYDASDFAARQAPFGRSNGPAQPDNAPSRSRVKQSEMAAADEDAAPPPPRNGAFAKSTSNPFRGKPGAAAQGIQDPYADDAEDDAPPHAASRMNRTQARPAPAPMSFDSDEDETFDEDETAEETAPAKANGGGLFASLFGRRAPKQSKPQSEVATHDEEDDMGDEDAEELPSAPRGFAKPAGRNAQREGGDNAAPPGIPKPRGYFRHDSKRGPNVPRPNNVFSRNEAKMPKPKKQEHKIITMPIGPAKMAFDIDDANRQQKQAIAARKRRRSTRAVKALIGRYIGTFMLALTCGALWYTGIVEINPTAASPVKINWPEPIRPAVERITTFSSPYVASAKDWVGTKSEPVIKSVGEMFSNPTPTPSAAKKFDFAPGNSSR